MTLDTNLTPTSPTAVVLLSGGLDSTTVLAIALDQGFDIVALSFLYGQNHRHEIEHAQAIATQAGIKDHCIVNIDLSQFGQSALTTDLKVPKHDHVSEIGYDIPITYVPARNTIFLSYALALAEVRQATDIFIGVNALDYSGYPDCRPEFIAAFGELANLATKINTVSAADLSDVKTTIHAPLINMTKAEIIKEGLRLNVQYQMTTSCYDPVSNDLACGRCDACLLRLQGFAVNDLSDPIQYAE
ncbi:MAG: 7-cyano-7-deazaguanine synthase QueC [Planctomycetaceae bacterium]|nr:7-cyano-7-deazaguanine synthase QueC [Planctomycetaceae bacterium]MBT5599154.1 7-cyano-7-deazaguanine synthase QueC [Planctomycetaceae bacterium]MBT6847336.1 7-cyano-7-deazaguanine synthase QueC [Planctomycetaceae bacterium]MBT7253513.1 7-cyano-7-deazaguanine synthase QueC [Planctomycetaceae bacterium]